MGNKMNNINLSILIIFIFNLFNISANANNLTIDNLNRKFLIFIEKEFLNYQIKVKNEDNQIYIYDKKNNKYFVELKLLTNSYSNQTNENQKAIPILKVRDNNNLYLTSSRTLQSHTNFDLLEIENISKIFRYQNNIFLEIGFGDGENLINSAKTNPNCFYIGADPYLNTTAKCLSKILQYDLKNVVIWPDDVRKILKFFPIKSISEIKILFPDPWPKKKHKNQPEAIKTNLEP